MTGCPAIWCPSRQDLLDLTRYVARYSTSSWRPWALDCALVPWCNTIYITISNCLNHVLGVTTFACPMGTLSSGHDFGPICKIRYVIYLFINIIWLVVSTYPSEKYDFVSWDDDIPKIWKIKFSSKLTTRYVIYLTIFGHMPWYQSWSLPIRKKHFSPKDGSAPNWWSNTRWSWAKSVLDTRRFQGFQHGWEFQELEVQFAWKIIDGDIFQPWSQWFIAGG